MILRRLAEAIREQNWFTVALEVLIVVIGIFVGLQVDDWSQARAERTKEMQTLKRMEVEILSAQAIREDDERRAFARAEALYSVRKILLGVDETRPFSRHECTSISLSHNTPLPGDSIFVLDELIMTGRHQIIQDAVVREKMLALISQRNRARLEAAEAVQSSIDLAIAFPGLIRMGLVSTDDPRDLDGFVPIAECDVDKMQKNQAFLNAISSNIGNYNSYLNLVFVYLTPHYSALHQALDMELEIAHDDGAEGTQ